MTAIVVTAPYLVYSQIEPSRSTAQSMGQQVRLSGILPVTACQLHKHLQHSSEAAIGKVNVGVGSKLQLPALLRASHGFRHAEAAAVVIAYNSNLDITTYPACVDNDLVRFRKGRFTDL